jgi:hypothetical protein
MKLKKLMLRLFVIFIFAYLFYRLYNTWGDLTSYNFELNYWFLALAVLTFLFFYLLEGIGYYIYVKLVHGKVPFMKILKARYVSDMGRYIPGKVWTYLGRIYLLKNYDITKTQILTSSMLEMAIMALGSILVFAISLLFWDLKIGVWIYVIFLLIPLILLFVHPKILNFFLHLVQKLTKKELIKIRTKYSQLLWTIPFYLFYWLIYGLGSYLIIRSLTEISFTKIPIIIGIFSISWLIGFVSLIAPGGLGVREGLLTLFLIFLMPEPIAIIAVLTSRIILTAIEGLYALISLKF